MGKRGLRLGGHPAFDPMRHRNCCGLGTSHQMVDHPEWPALKIKAGMHRAVQAKLGQHLQLSFLGRSGMKWVYDPELDLVTERWVLEQKGEPFPTNLSARQESPVGSGELLELIGAASNLRWIKHRNLIKEEVTQQRSAKLTIKQRMERLVTVVIQALVARPLAFRVRAMFRQL